MKIKYEEPETPDTVSRYEPVDESKKAEVSEAIHELLQEVEYFGHLLKTHELEDKNTLKYCIPKVNMALSTVHSYLEELHRRKVEPIWISIRLGDLKTIEDPIKKWLDKYKGYQGG